MSTVLLFKSMSLDGYVAGPNVSDEHPMGEGGEQLHGWMTAASMAAPDQELIAEVRDRVGASVVGRRTFEVGQPLWRDVPWPGPSFVVTHEERAPLPQSNGTFTFVPDVADAVKLAREAAGDATVILLGGALSRQALAAGLVDEVAMDVVPVVFGSGKRYFGSVEAQHLLEDPHVVIQGDRVLHLRYRVRR